MAESAQQNQVKIPLKLRMKAWWDGHEIVVRPKAAEGAAGQAGSAGVSAQGEAGALPELVWPPERIALAQEVWGEGFCGPGGPEMAIRLVKPIGLNPAMSLLFLGVELGGGARAIAEHFGVWVTGYEADAELAEAGSALSAKSELAKKATVEHFDLAAFEAKDRAFDAIFCHDFGFLFEDKEALLKAVVARLKPGGHLVMSDYTQPEEGPLPAALAEWAEGEPVAPHLWPRERYKAVLTEEGLDVRIAEDITAQLRTDISEAWSGYLAQMDPREPGGPAPQALAFEVKLWMTRAKLLEGGQLTACRFHAMKRHDDGLLAAVD